MDKSTLSNKMITWDHETKVKFNMDIHGFKKGQVVKYSAMPNGKKTLVRRRFADNDGCVELVSGAPKAVVKKEVPSKQSSMKPNNGKTGSNTNKKENN